MSAVTSMSAPAADPDQCGRPTRLGIVMPLAEVRGGAEMALVRFLGGVAPGRRPQIFVCFLEDGTLAQWARSQSYSVAVVPCGRLRRPEQVLSCVLRLRGWLRRHQIDVVLAWMEKAHLYSGVAAMSVAGLKAAWWQHGIPAGRGLDRIASLIPAWRILACSQAAAKAQRVISGRKTEVLALYPPVDMVEAQAATACGPYRAHLGLPADKLVIGMVARLESWKGVHVFLAAAAYLMQARRDLHFVVVGGEHALDSSYAASLRVQIRHQRLQDHFVLCGHQVNPLEWLHSMDVVVNASFGEPFGMAIVEAQALGKPVVATRLGGPAEIITDGKDGLLFDPGDAAALAAALQRLCEDALLRQRLGVAAKLRAAQFATPRFVDEVLDACGGMSQ